MIFVFLLLHSVCQALGPSISLQMTQFCFFLCLSNIPWYSLYPTFQYINLSQNNIYFYYLYTLILSILLCSCCLVAKLFLTLLGHRDCSPPGSSIHGISQQECWSGSLFHSSGDLPDPVIKFISPVLQADPLSLSQLGSHSVMLHFT